MTRVPLLGPCTWAVCFVTVLALGGSTRAQQQPSNGDHLSAEDPEAPPLPAGAIRLVNFVRHGDKVADLAARYLGEYAIKKRSAGADERKLRVDILPRIGRLKVRDVRLRDEGLASTELAGCGHLGEVHLLPSSATNRRNRLSSTADR